MDPVYRAIKAHLREIDCTWTWFANQVSTAEDTVSVQLVNNWKRARVPPSYYKRIADLFGWTVDSLISGGGGGESQPRITRAALEIALRLDAIRDRDQFWLADRALHATLDRFEAPEVGPSQPPSAPLGAPKRSRAARK